MLASTTALPAALAALACNAAGTPTGSAAFATIIQPHVPDGIRALVLSGFDLIWQFGCLPSLLLDGLLAGTAGIRADYHPGGALPAPAALAGLIPR